MSASPRPTVLLIDLENFYRCRRDNYTRIEAPGSSDESYTTTQFTPDMKRLLAFVKQTTSKDRVAVRRAYADFTIGYLQGVAAKLIHVGVEPVQTFVLTDGGKNAADMRLIIDAMSLLVPPAAERFVLVSGDSDFTPLVLELRRRGAEVCGVGVADHTGRALEASCNEFYYFEEIVAGPRTRPAAAQAAGKPADRSAPAAPRPAAKPDPRLPRVRALSEAIGRLFARADQRIRVKNLHTLVNDSPPGPFPPAEFQSVTFLGVLQQFKDQLQINLEKRVKGWSVGWTGPLAAAGENGAEPAHPVVPARPAEPKADDNGSRPPAAPAAPKDPPPHSQGHYRKLLSRGGEPEGLKLAIVRREALQLAAREAFRILAGPQGRYEVPPDQFSADFNEALADVPGAPNKHQIGSVVAYIQCRYRTDSGTALRLGDEVADANDLYRNLVYGQLYVLRERLGQDGVPGPIDARGFAQAMCGPGEPPADFVAELAGLIADLDALPAGEPATEPGV
ncbi:MAG TPA: NYN domain-containing protein [Urbifossiella sp.]|nr:NYN domain-containing protein [Urbifossiella sp.]